MATTNVDDAVALTFEAIANISVTVELIDPAGARSAPVQVMPDTDNPAHYTFTFIPDRVGIWRAHFEGTGQAVASETYTIEVTDNASGAAPYATAATITTMWRALSTEETGRADTLCRYASAIIRTRVPNIDERIAAGKLDPSVAAYVCASMVLRVMRNPSGVAAESVGPWSVTYGSSGTQATGALFLSDEDMALLRGFAPGIRSGHVAAVYQASRWVGRAGKWRAWDAEL